MRIFASIISTTVFFFINLFVINNVDPGDKLEVQQISVFIFAFTSLAFMLSLFYLVYSSVNLILKRTPSKSEIFRRAFLVAIPLESIMILKIISGSISIILLILLLIIPVLIEWFYLEITNNKG